MLKKTWSRVIFFLLINSISHAVVPQMINYQGWLADGNGEPFTGNVKMMFRIYSSETGGTPLWSEGHDAVIVTNGGFNILLGSMSVGGIPHSIFDGSIRYLGLKVENDSEMTPRTRLVSVAYSYKALNSDQLNGINGSSFIRTIDNIPPDGNGNVDLVAGNNITITPHADDNQVTISASPAAGDNLGNHTAAENINVNGHWLSGDGGNKGIYIEDSGNVGVMTDEPNAYLHVEKALRSEESVTVPAGYFKGGGKGLSAPAIHAEASDQTDGEGTGIALYGLNHSGDAAIVAQNTGNGHLFRGLSSDYSIAFDVTAGGKLSSKALYIGGYGDPTIAAGHFQGIGKGLFAPALYAESLDNTPTEPAGIAIYGRNQSGDAAIVAQNMSDGDLYRGLDANNYVVFAVTNSGTTRTRVLEITGGGDLSEPFAVSDSESLKPGMVVSIDPQHPGQLRISERAYDHTVAGIISGANGIQPGLTMSQEGTIADGTHPVALTGRVYVWAEASENPIKPGDLLTTSNIPGHAMKAFDYAKTPGAILGKAMSSLKEGRGLVLTLVTLQ